MMVGVVDTAVGVWETGAGVPVVEGDDEAAVVTPENDEIKESVPTAVWGAAHPVPDPGAVASEGVGLHVANRLLVNFERPSACR